MNAKTLDDMCNITTGKLDANQAVFDGNFPFFTCAEHPDKIDTFAFDDDVVLVAGNNARGNFHVNRYIGKFNAYQRTYVLSAKPGACIDYIYYALKLELRRLKEKAQGSQTKFLTMPILTGISFNDIDFEEQTVISEILASIDKKIELNNKINAELEAMAKLIYDYWFVQFDFPDANGRPYKSSGGKMVYNEALKREIPEGWDSNRCSELFEFNPKLSIKKGTVSSHIDMNAIPISGFMTKTPKKKAFSGGMKFQNGDVVVARITPCLENGKTGLISLLDKNEIGFGSTEFIVLRGRKFDLRCFGASLSRSEKFRKYAISKMTGTSGRKRVNHTALEDYQLAIPVDSVLRSFENKLAPFFEKMTANTKESQELEGLRDWLLPMLMNGQVTVKDTQTNEH